MRQIPKLPSPFLPSAVRRTTLLLILALLAAAPAAAQGWIDPLPSPPRDWGVVKLRTDVRVEVTSRVAEVEVEEWFENRGGGLGEGDYLYPLPGEAVFSNFSLYQGDLELRGETMDAERARGIYEEIVRRQKDPALIELVGHGLVRARIFPIEPGQRRKITLRYTQVLERAGDALQFRYAAGGATGTGPRPHPEIPQPQPLPRGGERTTPERRPAPDAVPLAFTLSAEAAGLGRPFSPTHELDVERRDGRLRVRPAADLRGDFTAFLPLERDLVGVTLAAHRPTGGEDGYFLLTLSPGDAAAGTTPRDVTAVVDVSGSMAGEKMAQTRQALHQLLGSLQAEDRFRLVAFSNGVRTSGETWSRATAAELAAARRWIDGLVAEGGTNIAGALAEAFRLPSPEERLPLVVFLTDGLPTVGQTEPERIAAAAEGERGRARVFAFGVGYDVNTYLLDRLSAAGRGSTAYVQPGEDVETALGTLAAKITHPVLTDLEIADAPVRLVDVQPGRLPDLFAGEELVLFGRYQGAGGGTLRLTGRRAGRVERFQVHAEFPSHTQANDFIPRLWAARKLGELDRAVRLNGADPELVEEIRRTALRYGLLSEYTSYLVQEPAMQEQALRTGDAVAVTGGGLRRQAPAAAPPAPSRATGAVAVQGAESARQRREVRSAAELDAAEEKAQDSAAGGATRTVAGRTFALDGGVWVEAGPRRDATEAVAIRLYGDAYFALLRALPELEPVLAALSPVELRGAEIALRFGGEGAERLSAERLAQLTAAFRGR
ncbi:MAG TPA: VIT domain-containing protein [Thermoanaerobaculia bacterium]|nr:VIT domain-containing protein [Thermoanaerobaculia bacterium]